MKSALVIYHANCNDGFGAAWAFHKLAESKFPDGVEYLPMDYHERPKFVEQLPILGLYVYILDFSFDKESLKLLCQAAEHVFLIDHHKTAIEELKDWYLGFDAEDKPQNLSLYLDQAMSGAGLTWSVLKSDSHEKLPRLLANIQDRDLWKFELKYSKEINAVIANTDKTFEAYNNLAVDLEYDFHEIVTVGKHLLKQFSNLVESISENASEVTIYGPGEEKFVGLGVNCTGQFASEVGNTLAANSGTFGLTYSIDKVGIIKVSLRSVGDYDVSRIAKIFGGGGHKNAAGFTITRESSYGLIHNPDVFAVEPWYVMAEKTEDVGYGVSRIL